MFRRDAFSFIFLLFYKGSCAFKRWIKRSASTGAPFSDTKDTHTQDTVLYLWSGLLNDGSHRQPEWLWCYSKPPLAWKNTTQRRPQAYQHVTKCRSKFCTMFTQIRVSAGHWQQLLLTGACRCERCPHTGRVLCLTAVWLCHLRSSQPQSSLYISQTLRGKHSRGMSPLLHIRKRTVYKSFVNEHQVDYLT